MKGADRVFAYGSALGFLGDLIAGDPRRGHPVAGFGRAAGALERRMWRDDRLSGTVYAALCAGGAVGAALLAERAVRSRAALSVGLTALATWSVLGGTSLAREARAVGAALEAGDLAAARKRLPHLCGRDPSGLDADQIARAVVESVAENTSDAVVGALVWGGLYGVPGLVGFRAVNTLDAMVGHRSPRYARFGWACARLDDVVGYPGARLTAALTVLCAPHPLSALSTCLRDARRHPSPNAGPVESAFAGALRLRLGGPLSYVGRPENRPVLGAEFPPPTPADIPRAVRLSRRVCALALCASVLLPAARESRRAGRWRLFATAPDQRPAATAPGPRSAPRSTPPPAQPSKGLGNGKTSASTPPRQRHASRSEPAAPNKRRSAADTKPPTLAPPRSGLRDGRTPTLFPSPRRDAGRSGPAAPNERGAVDIRRATPQGSKP